MEKWPVSIKLLVLVAVTAFSLFPSFAGADPVVGREIQLVYIAPSDRPYQAHYEQAIKTAMADVVEFFESELDDQVQFPINPNVEVINSTNDAAWFGTQTWGRSIEAADAKFNDPDYVWIIYVDADIACGSGIGGTSGIAVLGANDLRGLTGEPIQPDCNGYIDDRPTAGWTGGLGHEYGHAIGLPHPPGCDDGLPTCDSDALMWLGFRDYPDTYLRQDEKDILLPDSDCYTATNAEHETAGRATVTTTNWLWWTITTYNAVGSNDNMGVLGTKETTLVETSSDYYEIGSCQ